MTYSDKVLEHCENPRNVGTLDKNDDSVGTGLVGAPAGGGVMRLQLRINDDGVIEDAKFKTFGCGSAIASSSLVTEWVKGMTVGQAAKIENARIAEELSLPPVKIHCPMLAEDAMKAAIEDWERKCEARRAAASCPVPPDPKQPAPPQEGGGGREPAPPGAPEQPAPLPPSTPRRRSRRTDMVRRLKLRTLPTPRRGRNDPT